INAILKVVAEARSAVSVQSNSPTTSRFLAAPTAGGPAGPTRHSESFGKLPVRYSFCLRLRTVERVEIRGDAPNRDFRGDQRGDPRVAEGAGRRLLLLTSP